MSKVGVLKLASDLHRALNDYITDEFFNNYANKNKARKLYDFIQYLKEVERLQKELEEIKKVNPKRCI